jgi:hypothetical protein
MDRSLVRAREVARQAGIRGWETLAVARQKGKRFSIRSPAGKLVSFGAWPLADGTFLDHQDEKKRTAWRARHGVRGDMNDPETPLYYAWHILW